MYINKNIENQINLISKQKSSQDSNKDDKAYQTFEPKTFDVD